MINRTLTTLVILCLTLAAAHAGQRYVGEWAGEDFTSIEVLSEDPLTVMYCIKTECSEWNPTGTADDMTFNFPAGNRFPGAVMTMKRDGEFYQGWYKQTGAEVSYRVTLVKG